LADCRTSLSRFYRDQNTGPSWLPLAASIIVIVAYWTDLGGPPPDTAEYHYERLLELRRDFYLPNNKWNRQLNSRGLVWNLNGRPTIQEQEDEIQLHKRALFKMNFFEVAAFSLDPTNFERNLSILTQRNSGRIFEWETNQDHVWITARREDMLAIARSIREITGKTGN
jgi:hypothetical protein